MKTRKMTAQFRKTVDKDHIYVFRSGILRALSDENRQNIIMILGKSGPLCVNDLAAHFNIGRPTISHHLNILKEAKVVRAQKLGKETFYSLNSRHISRSLNSLLKIIESI